jgi:integrase
MEGGKAWDLWLTKLQGKAPATRIAYVGHMKAFLETNNLGAEEFYQKILSGLENRTGDDRDADPLNDMIQAYVTGLLEKGLTPKTCRLFVTSIKSWLKANKLDNKVRVEAEIPSWEPEGSRLALHDEIKRMLDYMPYTLNDRQKSVLQQKRDRSITTFLKDSGIRISDLCLLNVGDYKTAQVHETPEGDFFVFDPIRTRKNKIFAYIHIGPESVEDLNEYLEERRAQYGPMKDEDPLYIELKTGERINTDVIGALFTRIKRRLIKGRKVSAHSLRKFHYTMLERDIPKNWIGKLEGKKVRDSTGPYSQPEVLPNELLDAYVKAYPRLRVGEEDQSGQVEALRIQVQQLQAGKSSEIEELQRQLGEQQRTIDLMMPTFKMAQRIIDREMKLDRLIESSKEP